jgi:hypothetical protein
LPVFSQSRLQEMAIILLREMQKAQRFNENIFEDIKKIKEQRELIVSDMTEYIDELSENE